VAVAFHRQSGIAPNIEEELRNKFGVPKILPIDDAFSDDRMASREGAISKAISEGFGAVIPGDVLEFKQGLDSMNRPAFLIEYTVRAGKFLYYRVRDEHLAEADREYYPGVFISWKFTPTRITISHLRYRDLALSAKQQMEIAPIKAIALSGSLISPITHHFFSGSANTYSALPYEG
jgi:hypothetical protein